MSSEKKRVMVIDDSQTIRNTTEKYLTELGYEVMCCVDGLNGVSHLLSFMPDAVLIDVEMPRLDGLQTARLIRANAKINNTPIIMLSSKDGLFDMAIAKTAGANDYIVKPPTKDAIEQVLNKHLA